MRSLRSGALKTGKLGVSCKVNKCSDAGAVDLGVLPNHETSLMKMLIESHLCYNEQLDYMTGSTGRIKMFH